jgi:NACHT domain
MGGGWRGAREDLAISPFRGRDEKWAVIDGRLDTVAARLAGVLAAVGLPVAVVGVWRDVVVNHPVLAVVLLVVYEALVAVLLFTGKITTELRGRWQERIVDRLDRALWQRFSRFGKHYREFVLASLRFIDLKGLATAGFYTPELDEVFVDVSLAFREPIQARGDLLAALPADVTDRHSIRDFLDHPQPAVLAVVGAPGSGKTTLLRHTARQVYRVCRGRRRRIPILLYLRDHVTAIISTPNIALPDLVRGTLGRYRTDEPNGWFEQRLHDGDCLVLLDGLDEVARPEDRRGVAGWIECQIRQYPKNDYVITSRPQGYLTARIDGATVLQVRSFTDEQVIRFVQSWYLAVERHSTGVTGEDVRLRAESAAHDLLLRLNDAPGLYDLTVNPLLLTMIATVHRYRGALPGSRADLYGEICQVMLWRRPEAKKLTIVPDGDKKETLLRELAFAMMRRQVRDLPRADVVAEIGPVLCRMSRKLTIDEFLADIVSNGLLIERESGLYSFAHQTFQEYLAATHIRAKGLPNVLVDAVDDVWWRETTLLYVARSDADPIVRACLVSGSVTALTLAFDCAEQGSELAPELRDRLDDLLTSAFAPDTDPERRRLIAGVLLTRHLCHLIRTGNDGRVCIRPITTALYQLYQQDTPGPERQLSTHLKSGAQEPITGVSRSHAVAFVHWINGITGSDTVYRLPNRSEINDSALHRVLTTPTDGIQPHSIWLESDNKHGQPELWTPAGTDHPHLIDAATLVKHVKADFRHASSTLSRLFLLRSIITVRVFIHASDNEIDLTRDVALARALTRAYNLDLTHGLNCGRAHDRALDHALTRDVDIVSDHTIDYILTRDLDFTRACDFVRDIAPDRTFARVIIRALNRDYPLCLDHDPLLNLARELDLALTRTLARDIVFAFEDCRARIMGIALTRALTRAFHLSRATAIRRVEFVQEFIDEVDINKAHYVVSLDTLADKVHRGQQALVTILKSPDGADPRRRPWAHQVAINLRETALPVFTQQQPLTVYTATAIRIAALCLAAEADARKANQLGDTFREIAAGVTLLERRSTGQTVPTETIMLAIT